MRVLRRFGHMVSINEQLMTSRILMTETSRNTEICVDAVTVTLGSRETKVGAPR